MNQLLLILLTALYLTACSSSPSKPQSKLASSANDHTTAKTVTLLSSPDGQKLISEVDKVKYEQLLKYWVPQKKNYCGICSAVITINTSRNNNHLTQKNIFNENVKNIILPETISKMGLTLRELNEILLTSAKDLRTKKFPAHISGLDLFRRQLKENNVNSSFMIVNFSRQSIAGIGMRQGHFSIVAGYHSEKRQALILEVNGDKESFWIADKDLFTAMMAIDPVSQISRGWALIGR